jgi:hypothetical protein
MMAASPADVRRDAGLLDRAWMVCASGQALMFVLTLAAMAFAVGALLPQLPYGLEGAAAERWLASAVSQTPGGSALRAAGAFDVAGSGWSRAVVAVLAFLLALRVAGQVRFLLDELRARAAGTLRPAPTALPEVILPAADSPGEVAQHAAPRLKSAYGPPVAEEPTPARRGYYVRRPAGLVGPLAGYAGGLLLSLGLLVQAVLGWSAGELALVPGARATLSHAPGLSLALSALSETGEAELLLGGAGGELAARAAPGIPARWGNLWAAHTGSGDAIAVRAAAGGAPLELQPLDEIGQLAPTLRLPFRETSSEQAFAIPSEGLAYRAVSYASLPERGIPGPVILVEAYRGDSASPIGTALIEDRGELLAGDVLLEIVRERHVLLSASYLPGVPFVAAGGLLLLVGAALVAYIGSRRAWLAVLPAAAGALVAARAAAAWESAVETARVAALALCDDFTSAPGGLQKPDAADHPWPNSRVIRVWSMTGALAAAAWLSWQGLAARAWPGGWETAIAMLALGVFVWTGFEAWRLMAVQELAAATAAGSALLLIGVIGAGLPGPVPTHPQPGMLLLGWALAGVGCGAWVTATFRQLHAGDPTAGGRAVAILSFPLLTAAGMALGWWRIAGSAALMPGSRSGYWLCVAWLAGAVYLHATSGWRPPRVLRWLPIAAAAAAGAAGLLAAFTAS